jgi:hypothetical protein
MTMTNPKIQAPNPNEIPTANAQSGLGVDLGVGLRVGSWMFVGIWDLELGI